MKVCNCARAGTEACNHCASGTMVEPYYTPLDWRDEIIAALRAENARLREELENMVVYAQEWHDEYAEKWGVYRKELQDRVQQDINEARKALAGKGE